MNKALPHNAALARRALPSLTQQGFTLIELMLVVGILTVLLGIGIPNYFTYKTKSQRSDATSALMQIAAKQEQFFMDSRSYTDDLTDLGYGNTATDADGDGVADADPLETENGHYEIGVYTATNYAFVITATPIGPQASDDTCQAFTLDNNGARGAVDNNGNDTTEACW